jgi:hypothetical protein
MDIQEIVVPLFIILVALWRRDIFFYFLAAPVAVVFGLMWRPAYPTPAGVVVSLALVGIGLYCFIKGLENLFRKAT